MKTLLFASAAVMALAAAAPAFAQYYGNYYQGMIVQPGYDLSGPGGTDAVGRGGSVPYGRYGVPSEALGAYGAYGYVAPVPRAGYLYPGLDRRAHGLVPYNYGSYCGQMPKAC